MATQSKTKTTTEFGDFQTPSELALAATRLLRDLGVKPRSILEPTCGKGAFVLAAANIFPESELVMGVEINPEYAAEAASRLRGIESDRQRVIKTGDFFAMDWKSILGSKQGPWLILGNPPWVTSSSLSAIGSKNVPAKSNLHNHSGIEAVTGKSNFDISESMLLQYLDWLQGTGVIAVLCKTAVARKVLSQIWKRGIGSHNRIYKIDALTQFGAAVDACLFVAQLDPDAFQQTCPIFSSLEDREPSGNLSFCRRHLVSNVAAASGLEALWGPEEQYSWRSGIKHDCSRVMELFRTAKGYENGFGEAVEIEEEFLFPMLKGSDIGNERIEPRGKMVVPQKAIGQETAQIESFAPLTWEYLLRHDALLEKRGSTIYKNKAKFSIFGVGSYTFAPWKVAICGLYKKLRFVPVGPVDGRPVVFDDTVSFLPCDSEEEARFLVKLLHSEDAQIFLNSMIHWSDKRPVTVDVLKRLSLRKLAKALGCEAEFDTFTLSNDNAKESPLLLFAS
jgi:hypothetical protein